MAVNELLREGCVERLAKKQTFGQGDSTVAE